MLTKLLQLPEPSLRFGHGQTLHHPKDGLMLYGPYSPATGALRYGVIGTSSALRTFENWSKRISQYHPAFKGSRFRSDQTSEHGKLSHQCYPGFQSVFGLTWSEPEALCEIPGDLLSDALRVHERHTRILRTVKVFAKRLIKLTYESEQSPDFWFVIVPRELAELCRPESDPPANYLSGTRAQDMNQFGLFVERSETESFADEYEEALQFKPDFHNQLKARLLKHQIITQVIEEETLIGCMRPEDNPARDQQDPATIAWNLTTSIFYKTRRRPWILADARPGVCYMGIVFKRLRGSDKARNACCGAQMFLEDGMGMVFKGALGPWYSEETRECHLDQAEASKLIDRAICSYMEDHHNQPPRELFVHGSVRFDDKEWCGFAGAAAKYGTKVVGVRVRRANTGLKLYRSGKTPVLRGTALLLSDRKALLWTAGFVPRLNTYPGWNVPNPLDIEICNGAADLTTVLSDVLRLSKLNYNSCTYGDGFPITLKFAGRVGDILTTPPQEGNIANENDVPLPPLPFWHYI